MKYVSQCLIYKMNKNKKKSGGDSIQDESFVLSIWQTPSGMQVQKGILQNVCNMVVCNKGFVNKKLFNAILLLTHTLYVDVLSILCGRHFIEIR